MNTKTLLCNLFKQYIYTAEPYGVPTLRKHTAYPAFLQAWSRTKELRKGGRTNNTFPKSQIR